MYRYINLINLCTNLIIYRFIFELQSCFIRTENELLFLFYACRPSLLDQYLRVGCSVENYCNMCDMSLWYKIHHSYGNSIRIVLQRRSNVERDRYFRYTLWWFNFQEFSEVKILVCSANSLPDWEVSAKICCPSGNSLVLFSIIPLGW